MSPTELRGFLTAASTSPPCAPTLHGYILQFSRARIGGPRHQEATPSPPRKERPQRFSPGRGHSRHRVHLIKLERLVRASLHNVPHVRVLGVQDNRDMGIPLPD